MDILYIRNAEEAIYNKCLTALMMDWRWDGKAPTASLSTHSYVDGRWSLFSDVFYRRLLAQEYDFKTWLGVRLNSLVSWRNAELFLITPVCRIVIYPVMPFGWGMICVYTVFYSQCILYSLIIAACIFVATLKIYGDLLPCLIPGSRSWGPSSSCFMRTRWLRQTTLLAYYALNVQELERRIGYCAV